LISWPADDFDQYQLRLWSSREATKKRLLYLAVNNYTLITNEEIYHIQVRAHHRTGWSPYSDEKIIVWNSMSIEDASSDHHYAQLVNPKTILFMGPVTCLGFITTIILLVLMYLKRFD
jgi:hypothetical protein